MPPKTRKTVAKVEPAAATENPTAKRPAAASDDDEYEEQILVADLVGVLDASAVHRALQQQNVALRFANTEKPMIQVCEVVIGSLVIRTYSILHTIFLINWVACL